MNCHESQELMADYLSGELHKEGISRVERHLAACPACTKQLEAEDRLREALRNAVDEKAPAALRQRILSSFDQLEANRSPISALFFYRLWPKMTAAASAGAVIVLLALYWLSSPLQIMADSVKMHRQFLSAGFMAGPMMDNLPGIIAWSQEKLGYSVPQPALPDKRFDLLAGGICPLVDRQAAYVTYSHLRLHVVSLFMLRQPNQTFPGMVRKVVRGTEYFVDRLKEYNVVVWDYRGTTCILVSALGQEELIEIAARIFPEQSERSAVPVAIGSALLR